MGSKMATAENPIERIKRSGSSRRGYRYREDIWIRPVSLYRAQQIQPGENIDLTVFSHRQWRVKGIVARNSVGQYPGGLYVRNDNGVLYLPSRYFTQRKVWEMWVWE